MAGEGAGPGAKLENALNRGAEIARRSVEVARRSLESMQQRAGDLFRRNNQSNAARADGTSVRRGRVVEQDARGTNDTRPQPTAPLAGKGRVEPTDQPPATATATAVPKQEANPFVAAGVYGRNVGQRDDSQRGAPQARTATTDAGNPTAPKAVENVGGSGDQYALVNEEPDSPYNGMILGSAPPPPPLAEARTPQATISTNPPSDNPLSGGRVDGPPSEPTRRLPEQPTTTFRETPTQPRLQENRALAQYSAETQAALIGIGQTVPAEQRPQLFEQFANAPDAVKQWVNGLSPEVVQDANRLNAALATAPSEVQQWVRQFEGPPRIGEVAPPAPGDDIAKMLERHTDAEQQAFQQLPRDWQQKIAGLPPEQQNQAFEAIMRYDSDTRQAIANFVDNLSPQQRAEFIRQFADTPPKVVEWIKYLKPEDLRDTGKFQEILENAPSEVKEWLEKIESNAEVQQALEEMRRQLKNMQEQRDLERQKREQEAGKRGSETKEAEAARKAKEAKDAEDDANRKRVMWILLIAEFTVMAAGLGRLSESSVG